MNKAELESKHLSELHTLAAEAGVERYRMLPRAELIEKLADGNGGSGGGASGGGRSGGSSRSRGRGGSGSRGGGSRGGRERSSSGRGEGRERSSSGGGRERSSSGGGRERSSGGRGSGRGQGAESRGGRDRGRDEGRDRAQDSGDRERSEERAAPGSGPEAGAGEGGKPRRRRRRRRFRKGSKSIGAGELILAAPGHQSIVIGESREACTALLRTLAAELSGGRGPDPIALLVDPSPEELADWKREAPKAEIVSAGQEQHTEDALASAAGRAEAGEDVILLLDSATRLAEQFGSNSAKDLLEDARSAAGSGSLTIVAAVERS